MSAAAPASDRSGFDAGLDVRLARCLESGEDGGEIGAEDIREIAAFLNQDRRQAQSRDRGPDATEAIRGHGKTRERIALRRVQSQRHDQCARREGTDRSFRDIQRPHIQVVAGAFRQRNIEIGAKGCARAALLRVAPDVGIV